MSSKSAKITYKHPIKVIGCGPIGSMLAIGLSEIGFKAEVYDLLTKDQILSRSRGYAITHSTRRILQKVGLWNQIVLKTNSFDYLRIEDISSCKPLVLNKDDLSIQNSIYKSVGWIIDHADLMSILIDRIISDNNIELYLNSSFSTSDYNSAFVIAADGPSSQTRKSLNIGIWSNSYKQGCLTAKVLIRGANKNTAYEIFRKEGPLALLPMGKDVFQVVWSAPYPKCLERLLLSKSSFLDSLASILPEGIEPDYVVDNPKCFPLKLSLSKTFGSDSILLVGDSCHSCHPIGGQGLNLCIRDIEVIISLFERAGFSPNKINQISYKYRYKRILDIALVGLITDLLVRLFSNDNYYLLLIRRFGFNLLRASSTFRRLILKMMTDGPMTILNFRS